MKYIMISLLFLITCCDGAFADNSVNNISTTAALKKYAPLLKNKSFLAFPELRDEPIKWFDSIPERELKNVKYTQPFSMAAQPGEFYVYQLGVWALRTDANDVRIEFSDLKGENGYSIIAGKMTCFNKGGINFKGTSFSKTINVSAGRVQALWIGIDLEGVKKGSYTGSVAVIAGGKKQVIRLLLNVGGAVVPNHGYNEGYRLSRLNWLNSKVGIDEKITKGYTPVKIAGNTISILGRKLTIAENGLPASIISYFGPSNQSIIGKGEPITNHPFRFIIEKDNGEVVRLIPGKLSFTKRTPSKVGWKVLNTSAVCDLECAGEMEFDGFVDYHLTVKAKKELKIKDIRMVVEMDKDKATYMMGLNKPGGSRPDSWNWKWDTTKNQDDLWLGAVNGGLRIKLKGGNYVSPLVNVYYTYGKLHLPASWGNEGKGGVNVSENGNGVMVNAYSDSRVMAKEEKQHYDFELLITPFKTINKSVQFGARYYQSEKNVSSDFIHDADSLGANIVNVHQGNDIYPFINYPYSDVNVAPLKSFIDEAHQDHKRVKVYYTTRELTINLPELWPFLSMNGEEIYPGPGASAKTVTNPNGPDPWLKENLRGRKYIPAWVAHFTKGKYAGMQDLSVITTPDSRLNNFYVAGLDWTVHHLNIDGIYIDDCSLDRTTIRRVRKILDDSREDANIDMHSWNHFNEYAGWASSLNLYMDLFPYIDQLWIGEARNYDTPPDYWLVEISGIPFGLPSQMLQDGGNPWRGMVYGITTRAGWTINPPNEIWKFWDEHKIKNKTMIGYWEKDCPVTCNDTTIKASVYKGADEIIIAVANWTDQDKEGSLTIDWARLGLDPAKYQISIPAIKDFQQSQAQASPDKINIPARKGYLIVLKQKIK